METNPKGETKNLKKIKSFAAAINSHGGKAVVDQGPENQLRNFHPQIPQTPNRNGCQGSI